MAEKQTQTYVRHLSFGPGALDEHGNDLQPPDVEAQVGNRDDERRLQFLRKDQFFSVAPSMSLVEKMLKI